MTNMPMLASLATLPGRDDKPNEDYVEVGGGRAVAADGAGGPREIGTKCVHGVPWFVEQIGVRTMAAMAVDKYLPLTDIVASVIRGVRDLHLDTCEPETDPGTPATTLVAVREVDGELQYLVLGDSTLVMDLGDDINGARIVEITDRRIDKVAEAEQEAMKKLPVGTPKHQEARIRFVTLQRELRNKPGGYPIVSSDPAAAYEAITGSIPLDWIRRFALLTDGMARFVEFGIGGWADLMARLDTFGVSAVIDEIRHAEALDPHGVRYPRAKLRDDVGGVFLTRTGRDRDGHHQR